MIRPGPRRPPRDDGSAIVEFLVLGVLLLVPLVYLVMILGRLQAATFAVEGAARDGARTVASAPDDDVAAARLDAVVALALSDQGFAGPSQPDPEVRLRCSADPCLTPEGVVRVRVQVDIVLPGVPGFVDAVVPTRVPVSASGQAVVDGLR